MRTVMCLRGLPASGKSTYARELLKKEPNRWKRVNRDDLRAMLDSGAFSKTNEEFVKSLQDKVIKSALKDGWDVIVDNTHLVPQTLKKLHKLAEGHGDVQVIEKCFNVSVDECLKRNATRHGSARVPDKVIIDMARASGIDKGRKLSDKTTYYEAHRTSIVTQDDTLPSVIMCDLDGTLAIIGNRSPYDATDCDIIDEPNWPVIRAVLAMYYQGMKVIFMSGRDCKYRPETVRFIERYCKLRVLSIDYEDKPIQYELHMRGELTPDVSDTRKDSIVKQELFNTFVKDKYNVLFVLDDRDQVCQLWRDLGLSCFQVNEGDF